jgi:hypothetical protein
VEIDTVAIAAGSGEAFAVLCAPREGGGADAVKVSTDGGQAFGPALTLPDGGYRQLAVASPQNLLAGVAGVGATGVTNYEYRLACSNDGGTSWRICAQSQEASPSQAFSLGFLGFQSPLVARWIGYPYQLWGKNDDTDWSVVHTFARSQTR